MTFFFLRLKFRGKLAIFRAKTFSYFLGGEHLRVVSLVLRLRARVCPRKVGPWPWRRIFFVFLALASSLVSWTPPVIDSFLF